MKCEICNKEMNKILTRRLRGGEKKKVFYCKECEIGMLDNKQTEADIKKYYRKDYRNKHKPKLTKGTTPKELFNIYKDFQEDRVKLIKRYILEQEGKSPFEYDIYNCPSELKGQLKIGDFSG